MFALHNVPSLSWRLLGVVQDGQRRPWAGDSAAEPGGKHAIVAVQLEKRHGERTPSLTSPIGRTWPLLAVLILYIMFIFMVGRYALSRSRKGTPLGVWEEERLSFES